MADCGVFSSGGSLTHLSSLEDPLGFAVEVEVAPKCLAKDVCTDANFPCIELSKVTDTAARNRSQLHW